MAAASDAGHGESRVTEGTHGERTYTVTEDDAGLDLQIDGRSVGHMAERLAPGHYYSHVFPFTEFTTAEALAQALIEREGEAWIPGEPGAGGQPGHGGGGH